MEQAVVTSAEEDWSDQDDGSRGQVQDKMTSGRGGGEFEDFDEPTHDTQGADDLLYDENADEEDEAYVNNCLRSGVHDTQPQQQQQSNKDLGDEAVGESETTNQNKPKKALNSDAVLSCPCCFQTVCMDCQQHERYANQYRAMFVMNIVVRWDEMLVWDKKLRRLANYTPLQPAIPEGTNAQHVEDDEQHDTPSPTGAEARPRQKKEQKPHIYYTVKCANCQTQVASLDLEEEIYHFYGCLASS